MADIERLKSALRKADAAGNTEDARRLAAAIRQAQSGGSEIGNPPPEGMTAQEAAESDLEAMGRAASVQRGSEMPAVGRGAASFSAGLPFVGEWVDNVFGGVDPQAGQRFRDALAYQAEENPTADLALRVGGGIVGSIPLMSLLGPLAISAAPQSLAGRVAYGAATGAGAGAAEGAASGAGAADEGSRLEGAAAGAALGGGVGGVLGAAAPLAGEGARNVVRYASRRPDATAAARMGGSPASVEQVGRTITNDDPARAVRRIAEAGDDAMLADAGPATADMLDTSIQAAGGGARVAQDAIEGRAARAGATIRDAVDDAFGPVTTAPAARRGAAKAAYDAAYRAPIDYAAPNGQELERLLQRVPRSAIDRANRLMQLEGARSAQILADVADDGSVTFRVMPDVRQLDYITRGLRTQAKSGEAAGALGGMTDESRALTNLSRDIRNVLKDEVPAYRRALNKAATEIGKKEARDLGEVALRDSTKRGDLAEEIADLTTVERQKLKEGVRLYIDDLTANVKRALTDNNMDAREGVKALKQLSSRASRQKLGMILGDEPAERLLRKIDEAAQGFELKARTATNSRTFGRQSAQQAMDQAAEPGILGELFSMSPVEAARKFGQSLTGMTGAQRQAAKERMATEIATLLTARRGPAAASQAQEILRLMERSEVTEDMARRVGRIVGGSSAVGGYQTIEQSTSR